MQTGEKAVDKGQRKTRIRTGEMRLMRVPKDQRPDVVTSRIRRLLLVFLSAMTKRRVCTTRECSPTAPAQAQSQPPGTASSIAVADSYVKGSSGAQAN
ncbi:hypothetical protein E4U56_002239 [Claviceps arundinis]|uniref:Uncharacterized protein n=1 Tax=Claviceps arundinis TaxID=1623583 RepID=A0A9P7N031_9HYPO|nr:hypothetical protein E4U56_002239 [Claviceps arundinis]